ncbi:hypothetical protein LOTGIDRAFT_218281 [Lottia gigantea]|uniref:Uncharacterized protein n=1 Tax=Lottia gigantea TaxID=225164 RepID=V4A0I3_LOTGI|nr:hypothetical protein LOTGIDRAFT_218281 [Lottia gigantea]ESO90177.1 hypothetical protein LOTGIDRAFT_218281 [Lottia gigantea]
MDITFLGTASAYPTPTRGVSCTVFRTDSVCWLFDCGEGSQTQLMRSQLKASKIYKIFISHLHGDHVFGLPGLLCTISQNKRRNKPVDIYGPVGLRKLLRINLQLSRTQLEFDYTVHELQTLDHEYPADWQSWPVNHISDEDLHPNETPGTTIVPDSNNILHLFEDDEFIVTSVWTKHRIPSYGFIIEEKSRPGTLDVSILVSKGVPIGPLYGKIKSGETITLENGTVIKPEDVVGPPIKGRKVIIMGDSTDSWNLKHIGQDADVLIHEATLENSLSEKCIENGHSTPEMVAKLAKSLNVKQLILTHFSQRYKPLSCQLKEGDDSVQTLLNEAEAILGTGSVICAEDFMVYNVARNK